MRARALWIICLALIIASSCWCTRVQCSRILTNSYLTPAFCLRLVLQRIRRSEQLKHTWSRLQQAHAASTA